ncbi:hypothetical protein Q1695_000347 [Nippostrongylus brasiliensis]|nr:hypothetical protein Q1695_000347 [Nippostrongylus brasiliensis]
MPTFAAAYSWRVSCPVKFLHRKTQRNESNQICRESLERRRKGSGTVGKFSARTALSPPLLPSSLLNVTDVLASVVIVVVLTSARRCTRIRVDGTPETMKESD